MNAGSGKPLLKGLESELEKETSGDMEFVRSEEHLAWLY